jgi:hypothetical protein
MKSIFKIWSLLPAELLRCGPGRALGLRTPLATKGPMKLLATEPADPGLILETWRYTQTGDILSNYIVNIYR